MPTDQLDRAFEALANPHRRAIVESLAEGPVSTPELGRQFAFTKQALSRHLDVLEAAGLVSKVAHGRVHVLHAELHALREVNEWITRRRAAWERSLDRLGTVLDASPPNEQETDHDR